MTWPAKPRAKFRRACVDRTRQVVQRACKRTLRASARVCYMYGRGIHSTANTVLVAGAIGHRLGSVGN